MTSSALGPPAAPSRHPRQTPVPVFLRNTLSRTLSVLFLCLSAGPARAEQPAAVPRFHVCVTSQSASIGLSNQVKQRVQLGDVLLAEDRSAQFFWLPQKRAWISKADAKPLEQALADFSARLSQAHTVALLVARANALTALNRLDQALADLNEAARLAPTEPSVLVNRGNVFRRKGQPDRALRDYNTALAHHPHLPLAYYNRALVWADKGNLERAVADLTQAVQLDLSFAAAYNNRGVMRRRQGRFRMAEADYTQAIRLDSGFAEAYANRGFVRKELGRYRESRSDYQRALRFDPQLAQAHNDLAWLLATCPDDSIRNGRLALQHARRACDLSGERNPTYLDTLAAAHAELGQFDQAVRWQREALRLADEAHKPLLRQRLALYQSRRPYREARPSDAASQGLAGVQQPSSKTSASNPTSPEALPAGTRGTDSASSPPQLTVPPR